MTAPVPDGCHVRVQVKCQWWASNLCVARTIMPAMVSLMMLGVWRLLLLLLLGDMLQLLLMNDAWLGIR